MLLSQPSDGLEKRQSEVAKTPGKRIQKANGARRSMWGEDGNDVRPYQVEPIIAFRGIRVSDVRRWIVAKRHAGITWRSLLRLRRRAIQHR
jgi:hypothetical protein